MMIGWLVGPLFFFSFALFLRLLLLLLGCCCYCSASSARLPRPPHSSEASASSSFWGWTFLGTSWRTSPVLTRYLSFFPPTTLWPTRLTTSLVLEKSMTLEWWMGASVRMIFPLSSSPPMVLFGLMAFLTRLTSSTRICPALSPLRYTLTTSPTFPLSFPAMTLTVSPSLTCISVLTAFPVLLLTCGLTHFFTAMAVTSLLVFVFVFVLFMLCSLPPIARRRCVSVVFMFLVIVFLFSFLML
mmetsp:Transcript_29747/g.63327  ORF Transcript_29747/g.63327 Transcript_29747/m.63327 type:complete len:242 (-) Transcript_29747:157-882(-)